MSCAGSPSAWWSWVGPLAGGLSWACRGPGSTWAWVRLCRHGCARVLPRQVAGRARRCFGVFCCFSFLFFFVEEAKVNACMPMITPTLKSILHFHKGNSKLAQAPLRTDRPALHFCCRPAPHAVYLRDSCDRAAEIIPPTCAFISATTSSFTCMIHLSWSL